MAKVVKQFDFSHGNQKYDWDRWFDGQIWALARGEDFTSRIEYFRSNALGAAKRRGLRLRTKIKGDVIIIQASKNS